MFYHQVLANNFINTEFPMGVLGGPATISPSGPTEICSGNTITLTASSGASYLWSNGANTQSIIVNQSGSYVVTVTYADNTFAVSSPTLINVHPTPSATISYNGPSTFCEGSSNTLYASFGNSYLWSNGATTQNITVNQTGNYAVTITDAFNCSATSAPIAITVNSAPPTNITASGPLTFCENDSVILTAPPDGFYMWSTGEGTQSIVVTQTGSYSVTVISWDNCYATSTPVLVVKNPVPSNQVSVSGNTTFCEGQTAILTASGGVSYLWNNGTTSNTTFADTSGSYVVTITNAYNCTNTSNPVVISVIEQPEIIWNLSDTICRGQSITLGASPEGGTYNGNGINGIVFNSGSLQLGETTISYSYSDGVCQVSETIEIEVVDCSSAIESQEKNDVIVFPNPFKEFFSLKTTNEWASLEIFTIHGQIIESIYNHSIANGCMIGEKLIPGIYLLKLKMMNGNEITKTIIKS
jgi:hypothetical protein